MSKAANYRILSERGAKLAADLEDPDTRLNAIVTLACGTPKLLAVTIRHVQIRNGRKANEAVRALCDSLGNIE